MQGMNFIAGLVLRIFDDEALAFFVMKRILEINEWRRLYVEGTPKLLELINQIKDFIKKDMPKLHKKLKKFDIYLEPLLASPFLTIFSNLLEIEDAEHCLERFILLGEEFVIETLKNLFVIHYERLISMDSWDMMKFIGREMYQ